MTHAEDILKEALMILDDVQRRHHPRENVRINVVRMRESVEALSRTVATLRRSEPCAS